MQRTKEIGRPPDLPSGGAISILKKVLDKHPDNYAANYWLATTLFKQKQHADSLERFDRVTSSEQFPAEGWLNRGARCLHSISWNHP